MDTKINNILKNSFCHDTKMLKEFAKTTYDIDADNMNVSNIRKEIAEKVKTAAVQHKLEKFKRHVKLFWEKTSQVREVRNRVRSLENQPDKIIVANQKVSAKEKVNDGKFNELVNQNNNLEERVRHQGSVISGQGRLMDAQGKIISNTKKMVGEQGKSFEKLKTQVVEQGKTFEKLKTHFNETVDELKNATKAADINSGPTTFQSESRFIFSS